MLRQFLFGGLISLINIAIHSMVMATGEWTGHST